MRRADFAAAWAVSDAVLAGRDGTTRDDPLLPYHARWVWDGRPLAGARVLVRCYHGLGDTLQFCRFLPALARVAAAVEVEAQPALVGLLRQLAGIRVHPFDPARPLPQRPVEVEIMELSHALRSPPHPAPYLHAEPLPGAGGVGFCWQGGGWDAARDVPPRLLRPLLRNVQAVSLQRGPAARALPEVPDPLRGSMDVAVLARLIARLDAVVTVDTMVAHLAAALGRPTYVLLKHTADWRWGQGDACPWYGAVQCVRQPAEGDWASAIQALELSAMGDVHAGQPCWDRAGRWTSSSLD